MTNPARTLEGRVVVVTGAGRGIGRGIAVELGKRGAKVVVGYSSSGQAAAEVVKELGALGAAAVAVQADVTRQAEIDQLFARTVAEFGRVDVVRFDRVFAVNARAQFFVAVAAARHMSTGGRIVLMSSVAARVMGVRDHSQYAGSKSAVEGFTRSLATDFGPRGITVNAIAPGGVKTDIFAEAATNYIPGADPPWPADRIEAAMAGSCPMGRVALPADIGRVIAWLASDDSEWVTGQVILCSGGSSI